MTSDNLVLAALVSEWTATCTSYIRAWDNPSRDKNGMPVKQKASHIAYVARQGRLLKEDICCARIVSVACFR